MLLQNRSSAKQVTLSIEMEEFVPLPYDGKYDEVLSANKNREFDPFNLPKIGEQFFEF
jgi:hypothetical protein